MAEKINLDMEQLGALCRLKPTLADCAAFFKCSEDTIERRLKEQFRITFAEFREQNMIHTRHDLIRLALAKAPQSDAMHIFCLKNLCGWRDRQPEEVSQSTINNLSVSQLSDQRLDIEIQERIEMLVKAREREKKTSLERINEKNEPNNLNECIIKQGE